MEVVSLRHVSGFLVIKYTFSAYIYMTFGDGKIRNSLLSFPNPPLLLHFLTLKELLSNSHESLNHSCMSPFKYKQE